MRAVLLADAWEQETQRILANSESFDWMQLAFTRENRKSI